MFSCEIVLAAVLLSAPKDLPVLAEQATWVEAMRPCVLALAIDAEILDPRERAFLIMQDPAGDLAMLRGRNEEFARAPLLDECQRFPERKLINDFLALNRSYRNDLNARLAIDLVHMEELRTAICETDQLYQVWDTVRDARCDYYYVTVRRQSLQLLRDLIGAEAFYSGQMPPNVPVRHFPRGR
jgi:hypothetical protein